MPIDGTIALYKPPPRHPEEHNRELAGKAAQWQIPPVASPYTGSPSIYLPNSGGLPGKPFLVVIDGINVPPLVFRDFAIYSVVTIL